MVATAGDPGTAPVVVAVDERLPPGADVGDALSAVPGAVVRRLGGLGAYTEVSLRGSTSRQVEVQIDGIPLDPDGVSVTNLAELPLWAFQEVRVWRSNPPAASGPGGVGGVVDLITGDPIGFSGSVAGGSHGAAVGHALAAGPGVLVAADVLGLQGNFNWLSDGGTPFTTLDDRLEMRTNADKRQASALLRLRGGEGVRWTLLDTVLAREEGVPGFTFATTDAVRYAAARNLTAFEATGATGSSRITGRGWLVTRGERLADPQGEIGVGSGGSESSLQSGGLRGLVEAAPAPWLAASAVVEGRIERGRSSGPSGPTVRTREVVRSALSASAWADDVEVQPTLWVLALADGGQVAVHPLPRLGAVWRPLKPLSLRASGGRTVRPPDPDELFGDRGAFVGNPDLRPEDAWQADLGLGLRRSGFDAELGAWWREVVDLIAFVQDANQVARPINLNRARVRGVDVGLSASAAGGSVRIAGTVLDSANRSADPAYAGNALPRLPAFELEAGVSARRAWAQLGYGGSFTAGNWLDAANFALAPPRFLHGIFARADLGGGWQLTADARNVTDQIAVAGPRDPLVNDGVLAVRAVTDFTGYPLPGRTVLVGVAWLSP